MKQHSNHLNFIFREVDNALIESAFAYPGLYGILQRLYPFTAFAKAVQKVMDDALVTLNKRRSGKEGRKEDVLQYVVDAQEGVGNIRSTTSDSARLIDDHTLVCNFAVLILAGFDTTSASLAFLLYLLAKHPEEQVKIRDEIASVLCAKENSRSRRSLCSGMHQPPTILQLSKNLNVSDSSQTKALVPHQPRTA
ncbi:hypothetical protein MTO96_046690 [Rhipicephalus appendiculatus]